MFAAVSRTTVLRRSSALATGVRTVSSSAKSSSAILIGSASPSPSNTANPSASPAAPQQQQAAGLRTAAASSAPKLGPSHIVKDGRVISANRAFHAISSESAPGLNQPNQEPDYLRKMQRMQDAKDLAGL